jgi:hypothetical protein
MDAPLLMQKYKSWQRNDPETIRKRSLFLVLGLVSAEPGSNV